MSEKSLVALFWDVNSSLLPSNVTPKDFSALLHEAFRPHDGGDEWKFSVARAFVDPEFEKELNFANLDIEVVPNSAKNISTLFLSLCMWLWDVERLYGGGALANVIIITNDPEGYLFVKNIKNRCSSLILVSNLLQQLREGGEKEDIEAIKLLPNMYVDVDDILSLNDPAAVPTKESTESSVGNTKDIVSTLSEDSAKSTESSSASVEMQNKVENSDSVVKKDPAPEKLIEESHTFAPVADSNGGDTIEKDKAMSQETPANVVVATQSPQENMNMSNGTEHDAFFAQYQLEQRSAPLDVAGQGKMSHEDAGLFFEFKRAFESRNVGNAVAVLRRIYPKQSKNLRIPEIASACIPAFNTVQVGSIGHAYVIFILHSIQWCFGLKNKRKGESVDSFKYNMNKNIACWLLNVLHQKLENLVIPVDIKKSAEDIVCHLLNNVCELEFSLEILQLLQIENVHAYLAPFVLLWMQSNVPAMAARAETFSLKYGYAVAGLIPGHHGYAHQQKYAPQNAYNPMTVANQTYGQQQQQLHYMQQPQLQRVAYVQPGYRRVGQPVVPMQVPQMQSRPVNANTNNPYQKQLQMVQQYRYPGEQRYAAQVPQERVSYSVGQQHNVSNGTAYPQSTPTVPSHNVNQAVHSDHPSADKNPVNIDALIVLLGGDVATAMTAPTQDKVLAMVLASPSGLLRSRVSELFWDIFGEYLDLEGNALMEALLMTNQVSIVGVDGGNDIMFRSIQLKMSPEASTNSTMVSNPEASSKLMRMSSSLGSMNLSTSGGLVAPPGLETGSTSGNNAPRASVGNSSGYSDVSGGSGGGWTDHYSSNGNGSGYSQHSSNSNAGLSHQHSSNSNASFSKQSSTAPQYSAPPPMVNHMTVNEMHGTSLSGAGPAQQPGGDGHELFKQYMMERSQSRKILDMNNDDIEEDDSIKQYNFEGPNNSFFVAPTQVTKTVASSKGGSASVNDTSLVKATEWSEIDQTMMMSPNNASGHASGSSNKNSNSSLDFSSVLDGLVNSNGNSSNDKLVDHIINDFGIPIIEDENY